MEIRNYTEPEEIINSDGKDPLIPKHPFRLLICGPSGCGKTNLLLNFIYDYLDFDALYLCAKDINEPKYSKLREKYTMFNNMEKDDILNCKAKRNVKTELLKLFHKFKKETNFSSHLTDFLSIDKLDSSLKNLVIFDDCVTEKDQRRIEDFFIRGRKKNATIIYLTQSYYSTPINIRKNCNYFIFFELQPRDITQIIREIDGRLTSEKFRNLYERCMQKDYDFFMLDLVNKDLRYRKNIFFSSLNKRMNKHRLYRKSKKVQGRGFFMDLGKKIMNDTLLASESKTKEFIKNKLDAILSKEIKRGKGLKIFK
jgi:DNA polymerase III delta prime subunit